MSLENCFLLLGETGVGKSTLTKILSENKAIKIGHSLKSETQEPIDYDCQFGDFHYSLIDTPGYDDSNGNDEKNYAHIKKYINSNNHKIKGIVLLFSFQDARFGVSQRKGLEKIVNLIPLDDFWSHVTIIFTKTFCDDPDDLPDKKESKLQYFKEIFDTLASAFYKMKLIKQIEFSKINTIFVNLKENQKIEKKNTKKEDLENIIEIFKQQSKLEPLFHRVEIEEKWEKNLIIKDNNKNVGDLFDVKYKVYNYYNQNGKIIKTIAKPIEKKFIKQLSKKEYDGKFQEICGKVGAGTVITGLALYLGALSLMPICPPISFYLFMSSYIGVSSIFIGAVASARIKSGIEYLSNKEFNEQKVIDELKIEEDEENYS